MLLCYMYSNIKFHILNKDDLSEYGSIILGFLFAHPRSIKQSQTTSFFRFFFGIFRLFEDIFIGARKIVRKKVLKNTLPFKNFWTRLFKSYLKTNPISTFPLISLQSDSFLVQSCVHQFHPQHAVFVLNLEIFLRFLSLDFPLYTNRICCSLRVVGRPRKWGVFSEAKNFSFLS